MARTHPPLPDIAKLSPREAAIVAWVHAVDINGQPRYGISVMPQRDESLAHNVLYDIIRAARMAVVMIETLEDVSDAKRAEAEARLAQQMTPVEEAQEIVRLFDTLPVGSVLQLSRHHGRYSINNVSHGVTFIDALRDYQKRQAKRGR